MKYVRICLIDRVSELAGKTRQVSTTACHLLLRFKCIMTDARWLLPNFQNSWHLSDTICHVSTAIYQVSNIYFDKWNALRHVLDLFWHLVKSTCHMLDASYYTMLVPDTLSTNVTYTSFFTHLRPMPHVIYLLTGVSFLSEGEANICWRVFLTACAGLLDIISSIDLPGNSLDVNDIVFSWSGFRCIDVKTSLRAPPWFYQLNNSTLQMFILQKNVIAQ